MRHVRDSVSALAKLAKLKHLRALIKLKHVSALNKLSASKQACTLALAYVTSVTWETAAAAKLKHVSALTKPLHRCAL